LITADKRLRVNDLKSWAWQRACGLDSRPRHLDNKELTDPPQVAFAPFFELCLRLLAVHIGGEARPLPARLGLPGRERRRTLIWCNVFKKDRVFSMHRLTQGICIQNPMFLLFRVPNRSKIKDKDSRDLHITRLGIGMAKPALVFHIEGGKKR
jgi:hypothetical protein